MRVQPAIETTDLVKVFSKGNVRAVDGISLQAATGSVLGLLGPNGAGKTTVVRILATILAPDSGSASVAGHDVVRHPQEVRRLIGLAGQSATVDENLTGRENLYMVSRLCHLPADDARRRATELLEGFGLADAANRPLKTYSGGMRRRLDVAAALVARPPVLFLDEPTTGLDPPSRQDLWHVVEQLVAAGTTVLLTTQYLEEADRLADRIVVVDHGRVIAEGTPAELKADLGATVVSVTLADGDAARRGAALLARVSDKAPAVEGATVQLTVENGPKVAAEVLRALDQAQLAVTGLGLREPSLDDVFLSLTGHRTEPGAGEGGDGAGGAALAGAGAPGGGGQAAPAVTTELLVPVAGGRQAPAGNRLVWTVRDTLTVTRRNLIAYTRIPEAVFFSSVQPVMFVLLFRYVFGGAIHVPGIAYVDYLMPGIFVQTVMFGAVSTSVGLAEDLQKGLIERFRALPMARSAVLGGRTSADLVRNVLVVAIITGIGYAVGFRVTTGVGLFLAGVAVVLLFAYSLSWGFAIVGLSAPNSETAQVMSFPLLFPLTFASSAFVPVQSMPSWLQGFATHQPVSVVIDAARSLMVGGPRLHSPTAEWEAVVWALGILVVLAPVAVWRYRRAG